MKHLRLFKTYNEFNEAKKDLSLFNVSLIREDDEVKFIKDKITSEEAGTIVLSNENGDRKYVDVETYKNNSFDGYTPIGIIVVPSSHTEDGKARMMSLDLMSCTSPSIGTKTWNPTNNDNQCQMYWGVYGNDIENLTNYEACIAIGTNDSELPTEQTPIANSWGLLANNIYEVSRGTSTGVTIDGMRYVYKTNPYDSQTKWGLYYEGELESEMPLLPSPYLEDGSKNELYSLTELNGETIPNFLSDMNGRANTDEILKVRGEKDYTSWLPTWNSEDDYPAASCCDMYQTVGTNQGDWYLPSAGELGYLAARSRQIQDALKAVDGFDLIGEESMGLPSSEVLSLFLCWSSTEYSSLNAISYDMYGGSMGNYVKGYYLVVAFAVA